MTWSECLPDKVCAERDDFAKHLADDTRKDDFIVDAILKCGPKPDGEEVELDDAE